MNKAIVIMCVCLLLLCFYFLFEKNQKEDEEEYIFPIRSGVVMDKYITHTTVLIGKENRLEQSRHFYIEVLSQGELLRFEIDAVSYGSYTVGEVIEWVR